MYVHLLLVVGGVVGEIKSDRCPTSALYTLKRSIERDGDRWWMDGCCYCCVEYDDMSSSIHVIVCTEEVKKFVRREGGRRMAIAGRHRIDTRKNTQEARGEMSLLATLQSPPCTVNSAIDRGGSEGSSVRKSQ